MDDVSDCTVSLSLSHFAYKHRTASVMKSHFTRAVSASNGKQLVNVNVHDGRAKKGALGPKVNFFVDEIFFFSIAESFSELHNPNMRAMCL